MKYYNRILLTAASLAVLASCADDSILDFSTEKPASIAQLEYLNDYDVLKSYVDRAANPNFKLGTGVEAGDYNAKSMVYSLASSNFDEMTAGNAMKYGSCVRNDGVMDFAAVTSFVNNARAAGLTVYGHTLVWHSQQNKTYLTPLIDPIVIPGEPAQSGDGGYCLVLQNATALADNWRAQVWTNLTANLVAGKKYTMTFMAKATTEFSPDVYLQSSADGSQEYSPGSFAVGKEWEAITITFTPTGSKNDKITFNIGKLAGKIFIDDVVLTVEGSTENLIPNGDFEAQNVDKWQAWDKSLYALSGDGEGYSTGGGGYSLILQQAAAQGNIWDAQVWANLGANLIAGMKHTLTFMAKTTNEFSPQIYLQSSTGGSQEYSPGSFAVGKSWEEVKITFTPSGSQINKITFNIGTFAGKINIDNVKLTAEGSTTNLISNGDFEDGTASGWQAWNSAYYTVSEEGGGYSAGGTPDQIIEKTDQEKKDIYTGVLETWIKGMLEACEGYVIAWDVVNEPLSGADKDGDGLYDLQSASNVSAEDAKNNFYWQDYLGKDYVQTAVKMTRQYGPANMKLFINDYNLESDWDDNKKLKSLIKWIERWESDGVTKVDGIGTQMHISYYANPTTQKSKEDHIVKMFELLAASGKLIKITELDMGYINESGTEVKTVDVTDAQHKQMAEYYKFIVKKYFEIIPVAQRYGITAWAITDSPDTTNSYWRRGLPIGLWDLNYSRKHAYAGFADGLRNK